MQEKHAKPNILRLNRNLNERQKTPFGYTLAGMAVVCAAVYAALFINPEYVGGLVLVIGLGCGVVWIVGKVRSTFTYASHDLADFVAGKAPLIKVQPRTATGQFASKRDVIHAALRRDVEAK